MSGGSKVIGSGHAGAGRDSQQRAGVSRRDVMRGIGAAGLGAAGPLAGRAMAQAKAPVKLSFWTFENPQQRPWIHKRVKMFTEKNPNVEVDFQHFAFGDLGKKLSVGYATGTAPEGFVSQDWFMPTWLSKDLLAPLDVQRLGYSSVANFSDDFAKAFVAGATKDGKIYGYPMWFYGFCNYVNTKHFKEVGLDAEKDWPQTWEQFGEVAKRLTVKDGSRFTRQGFKFAMHAAQWTMIQFNAILMQHGGQWFDASGKCTVNNPAGVKAMTVRASIARQYGAEDPADSIATAPLPMMDWLKERASMFFNHPIPPAAIASQNQQMLNEGYYRPVQYPGVEPGKGFSTTYGFNLVINARAPKDKQEVLHDMYRFIMSDLGDAWKDTAPFTFARKSGWTDLPEVKNFRHVAEVIKAKDQGVYLPRSVVYNELADAMHRGVQKIMLSRADIKQTLDEVAAEVDRATEANKKG
ncbi:MAG: extracellular solute-binding protein [Alphaproteobacteria bacterium]|nr:extracellular solute-binding protein [Alphaproteobacteria bacterium]